MGLYLGKRLGAKGKGICIGVPSARIWKDGPYLTDGGTYGYVPKPVAQQTIPILPPSSADGTTYASFTVSLGNGVLTNQIVYFVFNMPVTTLAWAGTITGTPPVTAVLYTQVGFQWTGAAWAVLP